MDNETAHAQTDGPEGSSTLPDSVPGRQLEIPDSHEHNVPSTGPQDSFECKPTTEQDVGTDVHSDASRKSGRRSTSYSSSSSRTSLDLDDDDVVVREEDAKVSPGATTNVMSSPLAAEVPARHGRGTKRSHDEKTDGGGTITPDDALASRSSSSSSAEEDTGVGEREPVGFMTEPSASSLLSSPPPPDAAAAAASASASSAAPPNSQIPPHDRSSESEQLQCLHARIMKHPHIQQHARASHGVATATAPIGSSVPTPVELMRRNVTNLLERRVQLVSTLRAHHDFRDPAWIDRTVAEQNIDPHGTNFPKSVWRRPGPEHPRGILHTMYYDFGPPAIQRMSGPALECLSPP